MKKVTVIGVGFLAAGIILFICGFIVSGFDIHKLSTQPALEEKTQVLSPQTQQLTIKDKNMPLCIEASPDENIYITYYENEKEFYKITQGNTCTVQKITNYKWYDRFFNLSFESPVLTLRLPDSYSGSLWVETINGRVTVNGVQAKDLDVFTSNGTVQIQSVQLQGQLNAETNNGKLIFTDVAAAETVAGKSSNGAAVIKNVQGGNVQIKTSNGKITLENVCAEDTVGAQTSNGRIVLDQIAAERQICLHSSNGAVSGEIQGEMKDFSITAKTTNGKNNLPERMQAGEKKLEVKTSNGNIQIEFNNR